MKSPVWKINKVVAIVLAAFFLIYGTVVTCVIVPWLSFSVPGVTNLLILTITTIFALGSFVACVLADPGSVPTDWAPPSEDGRALVEVKRKSGEIRFCQKCKCYKPPRSHHCRVCGKCILRMDHHCPWINNCVGHGNYKTFLMFLIYVNAAVAHALGLSVAHAAHKLGLSTEPKRHVGRVGTDAGTHIQSPTNHVKDHAVWAILEGACTAATFPLCIALLVLLGWNAYLMLTNRTTIEYYEGVTAEVRATRRGERYQHPYDLGFCGNLHSILGPQPDRWLMPGLAAAGDGLAYVTAWDHVRDDLDSLLGL